MVGSDDVGNRGVCVHQMFLWNILSCAWFVFIYLLFSHTI
jgi:hypothetical protein